MKLLLIGIPKLIFGGLIGFPPRDREGDPSDPSHRAERRDEGVDAKPCNDKAVDDAHSRAGRVRQQDRWPRPQRPLQPTRRALRPRTDPTDRSMQPMKITSVSPSAIRPFGEA